MAVTTTNLGVITAYGDAVAAGYTGTKAEWQALMASYATVGQQAVDAKNTAVQAKDTAVAKATEATTAANTATTKAGEASASAQSIAQSAAQIQENTDDISELKNTISYIDNVAPIPQLTWTIGFINTANGNSQSESASIRISGTFFKAGTVVDIGAGYHLQVYLYRDTYGGCIKKYADASPFVLPENARYRFCIEKSDSSTVTEEEIETLASQLSIKQADMRWDTLTERIYTSKSFELPLSFAFGTVYTNGGEISNSTDTYLFGLDAIPKWVTSITPPTGIEILLLAYIGSVYQGEWNGSSFVQTGILYKYANTVTITPEMHNGKELHIVAHKTNGTAFGSNVLTGFKATSAYGDSVSEKTVTTTVLGYDMLKTFDVNTAYATALKSGITSWMTEYAGDVNKIPFIVHTDQHGRLNMATKKIFDLLSYLVNWDEVSAIFNLGDVIVDHWTDDNTNPNPLLRNGELETALICTSSVPKEKQINIYGNHDTWYSGDEETAVSGVLPSFKYLNPYFKATGLRVERHKDNKGLMVVYDDKNMVKYLVLASWDYADKTGDNVGYQWYWINNSHLEWMIEKMAENTGHDLIIVSHVPLMIGSANAYDPITSASKERESPIYIVHYSSTLNAVWSARKARSNGSVTLGGQTVTYDFTSCTDKLLCAIAGHTHFDAVDYIGDSELMQVAFDWFTDSTIHFGLFDRANNAIKVWKVHNESNTPAVQNWTASFDM